jgi:hypothetical protein
MTVDPISAESQAVSSRLPYTMQRICIWSSVPLMLALFAGLVIAGWLPLPAPSRSAAEVQQDYVQHTGRLRAGFLLMMLSSPLWLAWVTAVSLQMRRMEGRLGPLSLLQLAFGWIGVVAFMAPPLLWLVAAYRADTQSPEVTQMLHDLGWLGFIGTGVLAMLQLLVLAVAILTDRNSTPVLPRWLGYGAVWVSIIFIPGFFVFFFFDGPLAWNGLLAFWLPIGAFVLWWVPLTKCMLDAVGREEATARVSAG